MTLREIIDRYGPTLAVIAALAILVVALPNKDGGSGAVSAVTSANQTVARAVTDTTTTTGAAEEFAPSATGAVAVPGAARAGVVSAPRGGSGQAASAGVGGAAQGAVQKVCRADGRQPGISVYQPPCQALFTGDNGGATAKGVFRDKVVITRYMSQVNAANQAVLIAIGADDTREDQDRMDAAIVRYFNLHTETYGREVQIVTVEASGPDTNDQAMRADAVKIAEEIKAFANWGGPTALQEELAARGVICACSVSQGRSYYKQTKGYMWSALPMLEEYYFTVAEYVGKRLANKPAKWAGDAATQAQPRKFGLIYLEGSATKVDPRAKEAKDYFDAELKKYGVTLARSVAYAGDTSRAQEQSTNIISQMKSAGVNNVIFIGDPLYPIFVTQEATRQVYFPEWFITGTALIDTSFFGRTYDKNQWNHAFGISPLWVFFVDVSTSEGYREYHHVRPGDARGDEGVSINVRRSNISILFRGVMMAGPTLTAKNFEQGMYNYPKSGGTPDAPLVYYTPDSPTSIKDFTEVWWNASGQGKDETGKDGAGILMKAEGGRRYEFGTWPKGDPKVFDAASSVFTKDFPIAQHEQDGHTHAASVKCLSCK